MSLVEAVPTVNARTLSVYLLTHTAKLITSTASLGARLLSPGNLSSQVGWTIRKGHDFPPESLKQLETWDLTLSIIHEDRCLSTRGQLNYLDSTLASNASAFTRLESDS